MKQETLKQPAFTLLEMIIAITVFTIFIGFVMSSYLAFHRAQQEALATRRLLLETEATMSQVTQLLRENRIDYTAYAESRFGNADILSAFNLGIDRAESLSVDTLRLVSPDASESIVLEWDEEAEQFTLQRFGADGEPQDGYLQPLPLHGEATRAQYVDFRIYPDEDPYDSANIRKNNLQYQPIVQVTLHFATEGRVREEIVLDLQSSVTSRFYQ